MCRWAQNKCDLRELAVCMHTVPPVKGNWKRDKIKKTINNAIGCGRTHFICGNKRSRQRIIVLMDVATGCLIRYRVGDCKDNGKYDEENISSPVEFFLFEGFD
jgi:hypothetical protein